MAKCQLSRGRSQCGAVVAVPWTPLGGLRTHLGSFASDSLRNAGPRGGSKLPETPITQLVGILAASIAPVIVISGVGLLLLSMTNRYSRVIDRARELTKDAETAVETARRNLLLEELRILYRRARILRLAIILSSVSILFVSVTVFSLFASQLLKVRGDYVSIPSFGLSLVSLIGSLYFFLRDVGVSLMALELEIAPYVKSSRVWR